jgi:GNAT superfamily N-acetyltransferase
LKLDLTVLRIPRLLLQRVQNQQRLDLPNMPVQISLITPAQITPAAKLIQVAFDQDPYNLWVFDKPNFNHERNLASLEARCEWGIRNALFFVATDSDRPDPDEIIGVGMWMRPASAHATQSWSSWLDDWTLWGKQIWNLVRYQGRGGLITKRYWIWKEQQARAQKEIWTDPQGYYFCNIVVVKPGIQGQGIGKKLFEVVTKKADSENRKCYLESSRNVPNVQIYEKLGFKLVKEMRCEALDAEGNAEGCDLFCMVREPSSSAQK